MTSVNGSCARAIVWASSVQYNSLSHSIHRPVSCKDLWGPWGTRDAEEGSTDAPIACRAGQGKQTLPSSTEGDAEGNTQAVGTTPGLPFVPSTPGNRHRPSTRSPSADGERRPSPGCGIARVQRGWDLPGIGNGLAGETIPLSYCP
jgi:hypothetical protein